MKSGDNNGYGTYVTYRSEDFRAYDRAPADLRQLMRNSVADWAAVALTEDYRMLRTVYDHDRCIARLAAIMAAEERYDTLADYGPRHPEVMA